MLQYFSNKCCILFSMFQYKRDINSDREEKGEEKRKVSKLQKERGELLDFRNKRVLLLNRI